jgi:hypothetical protein
VGILHRHPGAELDVLAHRVAKRPVSGHVGRVERRHVKLDEALGSRAVSTVRRMS